MLRLKKTTSRCRRPTNPPSPYQGTIRLRFPGVRGFFINHDISRINCGPLVLSLSCCLKLDASCNIILPDERLINLKLNEARMQLVDRVCLLALVFVELFSSEKITFCVTKNCFLFFSFLSFSFLCFCTFRARKALGTVSARLYQRGMVRRQLTTQTPEKSSTSCRRRLVCDWRRHSGSLCMLAMAHTNWVFYICKFR